MDATFSNSDVIATASVVVAVLALFSTGWQTWLSHRHSRLSVKPFLSWSTERTTSAQGYEIVASLTNKGLGPAIVVERYFALDGQHFAPQAEDENAVDALLQRLLPVDVRAHVVRQSLPGVGSPLLPGDKMVIAHLLFAKEAIGRAKELEQRMERVEFVVVFEDIYGHRNVFRTA
jgi:hypothetical protein